MIGLIITLSLLILGYVAGRAAEMAHIKDLREREAKHVGLIAVTLKTLPGLDPDARTGLAMGAVVVSIDYFKRFVASLRMLFGGNLASYESVLDRARREALMRLKEDAVRQGFDAVVRVRVETSRLASALADGKGTAGIEILAYGTGVKLAG